MVLTSRLIKTPSTDVCFLLKIRNHFTNSNITAQDIVVTTTTNAMAYLSIINPSQYMWRMYIITKAKNTTKTENKT